MARTKLPPRRQNVTKRIMYRYTEDQHKTTAILITIGYDKDGEPKEAFCADFKIGTTLHAIVQDACIVLSRLLQFGDSLDEIIESLCSQPKSLIGQIAEAIHDEGPQEPFDPYPVVVGPPPSPPDLLRPGAAAEVEAT